MIDERRALMEKATAHVGIARDLYWQVAEKFALRPQDADSISDIIDRLTDVERDADRITPIITDV